MNNGVCIKTGQDQISPSSSSLLLQKGASRNVADFRRDMNFGEYDNLGWKGDQMRFRYEEGLETCASYEASND